MKKSLRALIGTLALLTVPCATLAQDAYPSRSVRWVVPFPPGGPTDTLSRVLAAKLADAWNQPVVVDNKGGASGMIGSEIVAKANPDGYTVMLGTQSTHGSNAGLFPNMPYDPLKDFQPLTLIGTACLALIVPPETPVDSPKAFVEWVRKHGKPVNYASVLGSSQHIGGELFKLRAGIDATNVPYRGGAAAVQDLMAGRVAYMFDNLPSALPLGRAGKIKVLAQTCAVRSPSAADLPTMVEAGFADFVLDGWYGIFAPARTPRPIVDKLNADIVKALRQPDAMERWKTLGFDPVGSTPEAFAERQRADLEYWKRLIALTGVKAE